jgi:hypothetical protein
MRDPHAQEHVALRRMHDHCAVVIADSDRANFRIGHVIERLIVDRRLRGIRLELLYEGSNLLLLRLWYIGVRAKKIIRDGNLRLCDGHLASFQAARGAVSAATRDEASDRHWSKSKARYSAACHTLRSRSESP